MNPASFEQKLAAGLDGLSLSRQARALVAVSGGRDSVALLHGLVNAGFQKLVVCHVNHALRGRASTGDARFVAALAARLGLEAEIGKADVVQQAAASGESIETAARHARYGFFAQVARRRRCRTVFLAHHADDQVETFLFNLFRGTGRAGLGGMSRDSQRVVDGVRLRLLRPLLGVWREEIDGYVTAHRLKYRDDASNRSLAHTRNRIRHELLPKVEEIFGRNTRPGLWRTADIIRTEDEWLSALAGPESETLDAPKLRAQPVAQQRRRILNWLRQQGVPDIGFAEVETVRSLLEGGVAKVNLPGNRHARRREKKVFLEGVLPKAAR